MTLAAIVQALGILGWLLVPALALELIAVRRERRALRAATLEMLRRLRSLPVAGRPRE